MFVMTKNPTWRPWWRWPRPWRPRSPLVSIGFWGLSGHVFSFPLYNLFVFRALFGLYSVAASFLCGVARPCVSLCSKPVLLKKRRKSSFHLLLCQILPCRIACILVLACASGTARPLGRAPRSFRNCFSLRNPRRLQCYLVNSRDVHDESSWFVALHTYWHLR